VHLVVTTVVPHCVGPWTRLRTALEVITPRSHIRDAFAVRERAASGSGLSLLIPSWHAVLSDRGEFDIDIQNLRCRHWLSPNDYRLGTPITPAIRSARAVDFVGTGSLALRPARLLAPCMYQTGASSLSRLPTDRSPPVAGYNYNSDWTPCMGFVKNAAFQQAIGRRIFSFISFFGIFVLEDRDHLAVIALAPQPAEKAAFEQFGVETIGLGAPVLARYRYARCVNDMRLDVARPEPAGQPETVTAGLESDRDAFDSLSCLVRLFSPAIEQLQQGVLVDLKLLRRLALDTRHNPRNEPARRAHLDHSDQRAIRFEGREDRLRSFNFCVGAPSVHISADECHILTFLTAAARRKASLLAGLSPAGMSASLAARSFSTGARLLGRDPGFVASPRRAGHQRAADPEAAAEKMQSPKWRRYRRAWHQTLGALTDETAEEIRELVTLWPTSTAAQIAYRLQPPVHGKVQCQLSK